MMALATWSRRRGREWRWPCFERLQIWQMKRDSRWKRERERELREWKRRKKIIRIKFGEREPYDPSKYDCSYYTSCITCSRTPIVRVKFLSGKNKKTIHSIAIMSIHQLVTWKNDKIFLSIIIATNVLLFHYSDPIQSTWRLFKELAMKNSLGLGSEWVWVH